MLFVSANQMFYRRVDVDSYCGIARFKAICGTSCIFRNVKFTERSYGISPCTGIGRSFILVRGACVFSISVAASSHPLSLEMFFRSFMVSCFESPCTYERVGLLVFHCAPVLDDMTQRACSFFPAVLVAAVLLFFVPFFLD